MKLSPYIYKLWNEHTSLWYCSGYFPWPSPVYSLLSVVLQGSQDVIKLYPRMYSVDHCVHNLMIEGADEGLNRRTRILSRLEKQPYIRRSAKTVYQREAARRRIENRPTLPPSDRLGWLWMEGGGLSAAHFSDNAIITLFTILGHTNRKRCFVNAGLTRQAKIPSPRYTTQHGT